MRRELAIALRSRLTWIVAALSAVLVGHGFVLAVDLFSAASRSAVAGSLQAKEMDPLIGVVRPTLGGVDVALALLAPIVAARVLSIEKERGTFVALSLQVGSTTTVLFRKAVASLAATSLIFVPAIACCLVYRTLGGHIDVVETAVAISGEMFHMIIIVAASLAAAAWTATFAQAVTTVIVVSLSSWLIDAGEGFASLAWLGRAEVWSIERQLAPSQHGIVALGPLLWMLTGLAGVVALACIGGRPDWTLRRQLAVALPVALMAMLLMSSFGGLRRAYDWTEQRRASLPPAVVNSLRHITKSISLEVSLDRDDSRRRQLESDTIAKLLLARPDASVAFPLDAQEHAASLARDEAYGRIVVRVGDQTRDTRSTSRKELVTLVLEAAGESSPDWTMPPYAGFPFVVDGVSRRLLGIMAYGAFPLVLLGIGFAVSRRRTGR